jgi:hypothetical protein
MVEQKIFVTLEAEDICDTVIPKEKKQGLALLFIFSSYIRRELWERISDRTVSRVNLASCVRFND